jgi:ABC-type dipeptide/oligopeptide/nickel transport system permease component
MALSYAIGVTAGIIAAIRRGTVWDVLVMGGATLGMAIPGFWLGLMLIMFFAVRLGWFPASGASSPKHFVLPILALGIGEAASIARVIRSSMLEAMSGDYIRTARAKGLREYVVVVRHALRNALLPVTSILGLQIGFLLSGAVIVETVFGFPGLGRLLIESILNKDFPVVQGVLLVIGLMIVIGNFIADVIYRVVDPRITLS